MKEFERNERGIVEEMERARVLGEHPTSKTGKNARADSGVSNLVGSVADNGGLNKKALFEGNTEIYRTPQMGLCRHSTRPRITRSRRLCRDLDPQAAALVGFDIATSSY